MDRRRIVLGVVLVLILAGGATAAIVMSNRSAEAPGQAVDLEAIQAKMDGGDYEGARADLAAVLSEDDAHAEAHFKMGLTLFNLGEYESARTHFNRSLELEPDRAAAVHHNLGVLAYQLGDMEAAMEAFQSALAADPDDADTRYQLGATYLVLAFPMGAASPDPDQLARAQAEFDRALEISPGKPEALIGLANIHMLQNDMDEAIALLEEVVAERPEMREALFALGRSYAAVGETDKAVATLEQFLATDPPTVWADQAEDLLLTLGVE
jgi:tetratricopeptide (TPR) repeat protein